MLVLSGNDISELLRGLTKDDARNLLDALSSAMAKYTIQQKLENEDKTLHQPLRTVIQTKEKHTTLVMPVSDTASTAVKAVTVPSRGDIQGAITVYNAVGELQGLLNAAEITAFRTALATMTVLTQWKVPEKSQMVVFGAGKQAEWHIRLALLMIPGIELVTVINRSRDRLGNFNMGVVDQLIALHANVGFSAMTLDESRGHADRISNADIICCCTPSTEPLFPSSILREETDKRRFISLIGSYKPEMQEVDTETIRRAGRSLYVDSRSACLEEAGELIRAELKPEDVMEAGELFLTDSDVRMDQSAPLTIFKCVGYAMMDLVISQELLKTAGSFGYGEMIESF